MCKGCLFYAAPSAVFCRWLEIPYEARVPYSAFEHMMMSNNVTPQCLRDIADHFGMSYTPASSVELLQEIQNYYTMEQVFERLLTHVTSKQEYKTIVKGKYCHYLMP